MIDLEAVFGYTDQDDADPQLSVPMTPVAVALDSEDQDDAAWTAGTIDLPDPCESCGSLLSWWNPLGRRRCLKCDPPARGLTMLKRAQRIRREHGLPKQLQVDELLAHLRQMTERP